MFQKLKYVFALLGLGATMTLALPVTTTHASFGLPQPTDKTLDGSEDVGGLLDDLGSSVVNIIFLIAGILAVVYLLWSGVQYITAGGNQDKVKLARQGIINAVIGVVVIMAAFFIIRIATSSRGFFDNNGQLEE